MSILTQDNQLELFDIAEPSARSHRQMLGVFQVHVRHDQAIIGGIAALIGLSVVFALGVERGKQLVRAERTWLLRTEGPAPTEGTPTPAAAPSERGEEDRTTDSPRQRKPKSSTPKQKVRTRSRYAVQVVTYSRPQLARLELKRLQQEGEEAFLVQRQGQTVLYVGPFSSKDVAREKLITLKGRYGDCFVRSL